MQLRSALLLLALVAPVAAMVMVDHKFSTCKTTTGVNTVVVSHFKDAPTFFLLTLPCLSLRAFWLQQINSIDIDPDTIQPGKPVKITANATILNQTAHNLTGGSVFVEIYLVNPAILPMKPVLTQSEDICAAVKGTANACPLKDGNIVATITVPASSSLPKVSPN